MSRIFCTNIRSDKARAALEKSVEQVVKSNKKVFDKLAKS